MTLDEPWAASEFLDRIMAEKEAIFDIEGSFSDHETLDARIKDLLSLGTEQEAIDRVGDMEYWDAETRWTHSYRGKRHATPPS